VRLTAPQQPETIRSTGSVKRVFKDAAVVDTNYNPKFPRGRFQRRRLTGSRSDLKPVKLDLMNQELPPWLVREPRAKRDPRSTANRERRNLLAVIHGYGANHWRDPEATQTFVLKNVVGNDLES
jgi:hypothetical protein